MRALLLEVYIGPDLWNSQVRFLVPMTSQLETSSSSQATKRQVMTLQGGDMKVRDDGPGFKNQHDEYASWLSSGWLCRL